MILQGQDGELRLIDFGTGGTTHYLEILFAEMDFSGPISRPRPDQNLMLDRNKADSNMHYTLGPDTPRYEPIPVTFSARISDNEQSRVLSDWLSGATLVGSTSGGVTQIYSAKGQYAIDGIALPAFASIDWQPPAYIVEIKWDGNNDIGYRYEEIVFTQGESTITESPDGLIMNVNAQLYGDVTRITGFTGAPTAIV